MLQPTAARKARADSVRSLMELNSSAGAGLVHAMLAAGGPGRGQLLRCWEHGSADDERFCHLVAAKYRRARDRSARNQVIIRAVRKFAPRRILVGSDSLTGTD
jgi:hypothetical protein